MRQTLNFKWLKIFNKINDNSKYQHNLELEIRKKLEKEFGKACHNFEKGNYRLAKWQFEYIIGKCSSIDSDSMALLHLELHAGAFLDKIAEITGKPRGYF
jgi:hypothetical protein